MQAFCEIEKIPTYSLHANEGVRQRSLAVLKWLLPALDEMFGRLCCSTDVYHGSPHSDNVGHALSVGLRDCLVIAGWMPLDAAVALEGLGFGAAAEESMAADAGWYGPDHLVLCRTEGLFFMLVRSSGANRAGASCGGSWHRKKRRLRAFKYCKRERL